jgi:hypothetical protein
MKESLKDLSLPLIFVGIPILVLVLIIVMHTEPNRYVGTVMKVSSWDGAASLKTKNKRGQDTIIEVKPRRFERFTKGQVITVWTGGDLIGDIATTEPQ